MCCVDIPYIICVREMMQHYLIPNPPSQAIFKLIPKEDQCRLKEDENTPEKRANKLWSYFEKKDNGEGYNTHTHTRLYIVPSRCMTGHCVLITAY